MKSTVALRVAFESFPASFDSTVTGRRSGDTPAWTFFSSTRNDGFAMAFLEVHGESKDFFGLTGATRGVAEGLRVSGREMGISEAVGLIVGTTGGSGSTAGGVGMTGGSLSGTRGGETTCSILGVEIGIEVEGSSGDFVRANLASSADNPFDERSSSSLVLLLSISSLTFGIDCTMGGGVGDGTIGSVLSSDNRRFCSCCCSAASTNSSNVLTLSFPALSLPFRRTPCTLIISSTLSSFPSSITAASRRALRKSTSKERFFAVPPAADSESSPIVSSSPSSWSCSSSIEEEAGRREKEGEGEWNRADGAGGGGVLANCDPPERESDPAERERIIVGADDP